MSKGMSISFGSHGTGGIPISNLKGATNSPISSAFVAPSTSSVIGIMFRSRSRSRCATSRFRCSSARFFSFSFSSSFRFSRRLAASASLSGFFTSRFSLLPPRCAPPPDAGGGGGATEDEPPPPVPPVLEPPALPAGGGGGANPDDGAGGIGPPRPGIPPGTCPAPKKFWLP